jgi:S1-C subfamily serine protease
MVWVKTGGASSENVTVNRTESMVMKIFHSLVSVVCFGLVMVCPSGLRATARGPIEVGQIAKNVTVLIDGQDTGSGVMIQKNNQTYTVLTAWHVLENPGNYAIVPTNGKRYALNYKTVRRLEGVDLAIAQFTSSESYSTAQLGNSNTLQEGMTLYVAGFPGAGSTISATSYNFTQGQLTARANGTQNNGYSLVYTNKTLPGMSGGPVFNPEGLLVGIHGSADGENQTLEKLNARVFVKTGFNLGIPINTFVSLATPLVKLSQATSTPSPKSAPETSTATQFTPTPQPKSASVRVAAGRGEGSSSRAGEVFIEALNQYQQGNLSAALSGSTQAIRLNSNFAPAYSLRGSIRYTQQDLSGALNDFSQAIRLDSGLSGAYLGRGLVQSGLGNAQAAIADYSQALQFGDDVLAYYNRGIVQYNLGQKQQAIQDLQKSADLALRENDQDSYQRAVDAMNLAGKECRQSVNALCDR